jgi:fluoride ion exporter CrcB/FEX
MENNFVGIGIWIVMGAAIAFVMRILIKRPEETPGHVPVLVVIGAFGAVIGGMLGVGIIEFGILQVDEPLALSTGGMAGAATFAAFMSFIYRWGIRGLI